MTFLTGSSLSVPSGCERDRWRYKGAAALGAYLHVSMPALIVAAALVLHALHNGLPLVTLVVLVSAAYGRAAWHDFMQSKMLAEEISQRLVGSDELVTHPVNSVKGERDTALGVEAT